MNVWNWIKQTPLWLVVPSVFLAAGVATAVTHYEPLVFDPSLYEVQTADAAELSTVDAEALEAANAADKPPADVALASASAAAGATGALADGTWTGYAACGQDNPDGWKPYYVGVTVNVSGGESQGIASVFGSSTGNSGDAALSWDAAENQSYLDWADAGRNGETGVRAQVNAMAASGSLSGIDTVSKATYSSAAIYNAYVDALGKAAAAAGDVSVVHAASADTVVSDKGKSKTGKPGKVKADPEVGVLADGTFTAYAQCGPDPDDEWKPYYVGLTLTVENGAVASIDEIAGSSKGEKGAQRLDWDEAENQAYLTWAIAGRVRAGVEYAGVKTQIEDALAAGENPSGVDVVSGATFSSKAVFNAFYAALAKSAAAAGSTIAQPEQPGGGSGETSADGSDAQDPVEDEPIPIDDDDMVGAYVLPSIFGDFPDGAYSGYALCGADNDDEWDPYYIIVDIEVADGVVKSISNVRQDEDGSVDPAYPYNNQNDAYLRWAIEGKNSRVKGVPAKIQARLDAAKEVVYRERASDTAPADAVSSATYSSNAIANAFGNAIRSALGLPPKDSFAPE